jgi:competence protein ComEA
MSVTRIGLAVVAIVAAVAAVYAIFQALDERSAPPILIEDAAANLPLVVEVRDGELVVILALPAPGSTPVLPAVGVEDAVPAENPRARININSATAEELEALPSIGEVIAARIIAYREQNGPFRSVDDLIHVEGISDRTIDEIRNLVTVGP